MRERQQSDSKKIAERVLKQAIEKEKRIGGGVNLEYKSNGGGVQTKTLLILDPFLFQAFLLPADLVTDACLFGGDIFTFD